LIAVFHVPHNLIAGKRSFSYSKAAQKPLGFLRHASSFAVEVQRPTTNSLTKAAQRRDRLYIVGIRRDLAQKGRAGVSRVRSAIAAATAIANPVIVGGVEVVALRTRTDALTGVRGAFSVGPTAVTAAVADIFKISFEDDRRLRDNALQHAALDEDRRLTQ
jgi:hypothetical protein